MVRREGTKPSRPRGHVWRLNGKAWGGEGVEEKGETSVLQKNSGLRRKACRRKEVEKAQSLFW